ncbi:hypothetical protein AMS68_004303 [Peltaster fructicola]|uniref:PIG-P domain-containing protein n=1 Tax=Peltaster fructicola TaxID=286661 RepID=A0A6H0XVS5_9PEZI|nr:hypothetical protein AMS68_004303 [Peltaster fructicola]
MPPQSRGNIQHLGSPTRTGFQWRSTPNLPTLRSFAAASRGHTATTDSAVSSEDLTSPSEPASIDDYPLEPARPASSQSPASASDRDGSEEDDQDGPMLPARPMYSHNFSRSHTYLGPSTFAPPFYNRPPTPLPPSPSLTSLFRPTFSSHNSRPTTPDPSSDEGLSQRTGTGTQTPNSAAKSTLTSSFRQAKPIPRASPKVPTYEYYGFTLYLTSSLAFVVYLLWAFLPSPFLHSLGIYYYPNRWWALAIPAWTVIFIIYIYVALAAYNTGHLTLPLEDVECLVDEAANIAVVDSHGHIIRDKTPSWNIANQADSLGRKSGKVKRAGHSRQSSLSKVHQLDQELNWRDLWNEGTDAVMDIPIGGVCEILYGRPKKGVCLEEDAIESDLITRAI